MGFGRKLQDMLDLPQEEQFLTTIGRNYSSHRFLANSTQAVYVRYVDELCSLLMARDHRPAEEITVLDWGCGKGQISYLLRRRGFQVTSCDVVSVAQDSAFGQDTPIIDQLEMSVIPLQLESELPFADSSFDCVVSFGVLEHVPSDEASMKELRRVLKPGGCLFITFLPYFFSWTQAVARRRGEIYHDRLYSRERVRELARGACFEVESLRFGQLFPKNSVPLSWGRYLEPIDRVLCGFTPMRHFATNLEVVLTAI